MSVSLSNVIRVNVSGPAAGLPNVNTSALAIITDEVPIPADFGTSKVYLDPTGVANDFGSNSETAAIATSIFAQERNVITGGGYVVVIPRTQSAPVAQATILSARGVDLTTLTADDYNINLNVDAGGAGDLLIGPIDRTSIATVQSSLNSTAVTAAGVAFTVTGELSNASIRLSTTGTGGASRSIVVGTATTGTNIATLLQLSGSASGADAGVERVKDTILRTQGSVPYFGICYNVKLSDAELTETANLVQALQKLQFVGSNLIADIAGIFTTITGANLTKTRTYFYSVGEQESLIFAAGCASRLMSINFTGAATAITMHLKDFTGLVADPSVDDDRLAAAKTAGCTVLANIGIAKIFISGANLFSDQVYTRLALEVDLQIAGFNHLATTQTKIPQTEIGMTGLKGAYRNVMTQYVTAGVFAPGTWNSATTFGPSPDDHRRNITESGFFIYSAPIADQSQVDRTARIAPLVQIAAKEAGAIHSSDVEVTVEP